MDRIINLINQFKELSQLTASDYYRSRSYDNAANILREMSPEEFEERDDFTDIYGIGTGINTKILQFKDHGVVDKLQTLRAERSAGLDPELYKVRAGFITKKITYSEADELLDKIYLVIGKSDKIIVAGSYRRHANLIGDLDILVPKRSYNKICKLLDLAGYESTSRGDYKTQYLIDSVNNVPMDIISYTKEDKLYQLLYLTGSKYMNIRMRKEAAKNDMLLNQYGLYYRDTDELVIKNPKSEKDIFESLGMKYVAPELR